MDPYEKQNPATSLFAARYRSQPPDKVEPWNGVLQTLFAHRSVRAFSKEPVPEEWLRQIIGAAQSAATSSNLQTWSVIAVCESARRERFAALAGNQGFIARAPIFLAWCADLSRAHRIAAQKQHQLEGTDYLEAFLVATIDAALAAQNATIAAESLGLGACYVGALRNRPEEVAIELGLPQHVFALFGMSLGYPDPGKQSAIRPRLQQQAILHFERYSAEGEAEAIKSYDGAMHDFQTEQKMKLIDWSDRVIDRLKDAKSLDGRDVLKQALHAMGFKLR
jgi:nitroreductase